MNTDREKLLPNSETENCCEFIWRFLLPRTRCFFAIMRKFQERKPSKSQEVVESSLVIAPVYDTFVEASSILSQGIENGIVIFHLNNKMLKILAYQQFYPTEPT